jgi:hypothetical protein
MRPDRDGNRDQTSLVSREISRKTLARARFPDYDPISHASANDRYLRFAAGQADVSRMMLRHLRSIRLIRAELHLCLLC